LSQNTLGVAKQRKETYEDQDQGSTLLGWGDQVEKHRRDRECGSRDEARSGLSHAPREVGEAGRRFAVVRLLGR